MRTENVPILFSMLGLIHPVKQEKKPRKCALPGCDNQTTHNGGYCCAEHCRKHREQLRREGK